MALEKNLSETQLKKLKIVCVGDGTRNHKALKSLYMMMKIYMLERGLPFREMGIYACALESNMVSLLSPR